MAARLAVFVGAALVEQMHAPVCTDVCNYSTECSKMVMKRTTKCMQQMKTTMKTIMEMTEKTEH